MKISDLKLNRFLGKDANQADQTKDSTYAAANPTPKTIDSWRKIGNASKDSEEDRGAPNILTGTVITSCFIQTSALPSRVEIAGNDITFYDDTYVKNGKVVGDTSRLIFTHDLDSSEGFIMEKRASKFNTYDNVLSWYATPAKSGAHNYMFIGRNGNLDDVQRNLNSLHLAIDYEVDGELTGLNGIFEIEYSEDGTLAQPNNRLIFSGSSKIMFGPSFSGFSTFISGGDGGLVGIAYVKTGDPLNIYPGVYMTSETTTVLATDLIPETDNTFDIGSLTRQVGNLYVHKIHLGPDLTWSFGAGTPEGSVTAPIGSLYSRTSGGASTTLYVKTSGTGNTGWTAK